MPACVPVRDLKDTAAFASLVDEKREVTVTKNGYEAFHCLSNDQYQAMQQEIAKSKLLSRIMLAEDEIARGAGRDFDEFEASIKAKYGL